MTIADLHYLIFFHTNIMKWFFVVVMLLMVLVNNKSNYSQLNCFEIFGFFKLEDILNKLMIN